MVAVGFVAAVVSAVLSTWGTLVQSRGAHTTGHRVTASLWYGAGLALDLLGWALSAFALRYLPVFAVQSIVAAQVALTVLAAHLLGITRVDLGYRCAAYATVAGLAVLAAGGHTGGVPSPVATVDVVTALVTAAILLAIPVALRLRGPVGCAVVAGLGFGAVSVAVRALHQRDGGDLLRAVPAYEVPVLAATGAVLFAVALRRGAPGVVAAITVGTEVLVAGALGMLLLGDGIRSGWLVPCAVAAVVAVVGLVVVARSDTLPAPA